MKSMAEYFCSRHATTKLHPTLKGGAGYCRDCRQYVQGVNLQIQPIPCPSKLETGRESLSQRGAVKRKRG